MQQMKIEELIPHPRNSEFFDDMSGDKWEEFLESIKTSGVIEPIVITQDKVIVSGHQRVRACKELGIAEVLAEVKVYDDEDAILKDLLETNIRQRGTIGGSEKKQIARIDEMKRIYGIRNGSHGEKRVELSNSDDTKTFDQILADEGTNRATYFRNKKIQSLLPEIQQFIQGGNISPTTAYKIIAKLTPEQQMELVKSLPVAQDFTQKQVQEYVDKLNESQRQISAYKSKAEEAESLRERIQVLQESIAEMERREPEVKTVIQTVVPDDYESLKSDIQLLRNNNERITKEINSKRSELEGLKEKLFTIENASPQQQFSKKLKDDTIFFCSHVAEFLKTNGGYIWITDHLNELPEYERKSYIRAIDCIGAWYQNLRNNINE